MNNQLLIEAEFENKVKWYKESRSRSNPTGTTSVIKLMLETNKIWWWIWEFIGMATREGDFLSHRAPARASDLAIFNPDIMECRKVGRFALYRLRKENLDIIHKYLKEKA